MLYPSFFPLPQAGTYLPQSYLVHEEMMVTERLEDVEQLGYFINNLCQGKDTYKLERRDRILGQYTHMHIYNTHAYTSQITHTRAT